jgi:hypothetical protein
VAPLRVERWFPIQGNYVHGSAAHRPAGRVPWSIAELAYQTYSKWYGKDQSLERLAARGGFGWYELAVLLTGRQDIPEIPVTEVVEE